MLIKRIIKHAILAFFVQTQQASIPRLQTATESSYRMPRQSQVLHPAERHSPYWPHRLRFRASLPLLTALARCYPEPAQKAPCCALHSVYLTPHSPAGRNVRQQRSVATNDAMRQAGVSLRLVSRGLFLATQPEPFA